MHYYSHHIGDFMKDTAHLTDHQVATYLRMIWAYYDTEKPIAGDLEDIAFAMRSDEKTVRLLLKHYFTESPEGWRHSRCDAEIQKYRAKQEKAALSASARWNNANALRPHTERIANAPVLDANQEPVTNNHEPILKTLSGCAPDAPFPDPEKQKRSEETKRLRGDAVQVLEFLNDKAQRAYRPVPVNVDFIVARMREGATVTQLRQVIAKKCREWKGDPKMELYLRPATLFNKTNFEQYVGELVVVE